MSKLTDKQWVELTKIMVNFMSNGLRVGQSYMNALRSVDEDLYIEITSTDSDCFFNDNKVINFIRFLNDTK